MFYDGNATLAPAFVYPGKCFGSYYDENLGTWREGSFTGYNVWDWVVAPFTNQEYTTTHEAYCTGGPNITSVFSANWPSQCPSSSNILATFAIVNIAVALSSLILGNQRVLHKMTFGFLGKEYPNPSSGRRLMQMWQYILPLGLQLSANAIITALIQSTAGYKDGFTFGELLIFLAARPRTTWIFAFWGAAFPSRNSKRPGQGPETDQIGTNLGSFGSPEQHRQRRPMSTNSEDKDFFPYARFAKGQLLAEIVLLAMASYSLSSTAHFASKTGFYDLVSGASHIRYQTFGPEHESAAKMMYARALWWIICFPVAFIIFVVMILWVVLIKQRESPWLYVFLSAPIMCSLWLGQWLFLAGFVQLMGPL